MDGKRLGLTLAAVIGALVLLGGTFIGGMLFGTVLAERGDNEGARPTDSALPAFIEATTTTRPPSTPMKASDFIVAVIVTEQSCFGSAGCNYKYTISPMYIGVADPSPATVIYEITGGDEPKVGNFEMDANGTATFDKEDMIGGPEGATLTATVTQVLQR